MKWQIAPYRLGVSHTTGEQTVDALPKIDALSGLWLEWHGVVVTSGTYLFIDNVAIEVIKNGSEVITSELFGPLAALNVFLRPHTPPMTEGAAAGTFDAILFIPFGRFPGDPKYFLDPRAFAGFDLKITQPVAGTPANTTMTYSIYLLRAMEGVGAPEGHAKIHTLKSWTPTASAIDYIDLPTDFPYLALMLSEIDGTSIDFVPVGATAGELSRVKLNQDAGKIYPVDAYAKDLFFANAVESGRAYDAAALTPVDYTNAVVLNFVQPHGQVEPLSVEAVGSLRLEPTWSTAVGPTRLTAMQLVK